MQIPAPQLASHLARGLARVYLAHGAEPLQLRESLDAIRAAARDAGYAERVVLDTDAQFPWERLRAELDSMSLFGAQRVVEVRLPGGKPGREGGAALAEGAARVAEDTILLVACGALEGDAFRSAWLKALDTHGVVVAAQPVDWQALPDWIARRARDHGLQLEPEAAELLAERTEGNLVAAVQELEKLRLLTGGGAVDAAQVLDATADSARRGLFELTPAVLEGDAPRTVRVLRSLRAEGVAPPLVLWALARDVRVQSLLSEGAGDAAFTAHRVFGRHRRAYRGLPRRLGTRGRWRLIALAGEADAAVKGLLDKTDPWAALERLGVALAITHRPRPPGAGQAPAPRGGGPGDRPTTESRR